MKILNFSLLAAAFAATAPAATVVTGNVTSTLGPNFFFNTASTGGGDTNATSSTAFIRNLGTLDVGAGGTTVSITGFGFAAAANQIASTAFSMTVTYLGADGVLGGGDDVLFGTVSDSVTGSTGGATYVWAFDSPLTQDIDGANSIFRFALTSTGGTFRFKTTGGTAIADAKFSLAGTSLALIPEPATLLLSAFGMFALLRRRR